MRQHIQDDDRSYSLLLPVVLRATRRCFRRFHVSGWEKVPGSYGRHADKSAPPASVILVTNHTCALMDPLVMLLAEGRKVVFMARADMFRKQAVARILRWLRILPIYRIRDGVSAVKRSGETIEEAVGVLRDRCPLCLYPEGTHRPKHSLLPLGKGVCHIALEADRQIGGEWPVYIVPAGIEYSDYFRFRPDVELQIGEPINVTEFLADFRAECASRGEEYSEARAMNALREQITLGLCPLFTWIPDDDNYEAILEQAKLYAALSSPLRLWERKGFNQARIKELLKLREWQPDKASLLFSKTLTFKKERERARVSVFSTRHPNTPVTGGHKSSVWLSPLIDTLCALFLLPVWLVCALVALPAWLPAELLAARAKDAAWRNTRRFGVFFIMKPLLTVLVGVLSFIFLSWKIALPLTLFAFLNGPIEVTYDLTSFMRRLLSDWRWLFHPRLRRLHDDLRV